MGILKSEKTGVYIRQNSSGYIQRLQEIELLINYYGNSNLLKSFKRNCKIKINQLKQKEFTYFMKLPPPDHKKRRLKKEYLLTNR